MSWIYPLKGKIMVVTLTMFGIGICFDLAAFGVLLSYKSLPIGVKTIVSLAIWIRILFSCGVIGLSSEILRKMRTGLILPFWIHFAFMSGLITCLTLTVQLSAGSSEHFEVETTGHGLFFFVNLVIHITNYIVVFKNFKKLYGIYMSENWYQNEIKPILFFHF